MRIHSIKKIEEIKELRKQGFSINELVERFSIPKTTIWHHIHNISLSKEQSALLRSRQGGGAIHKEKRWELSREYAKELLKSSDREMVIILVMLYWAEGSKGSCNFVNSDGRMIQVYLKILRNVLDISEERIKPTMRIFSGMNEKECLDYWSKITKIPKKHFSIRFNDGGTRGKTRYGLCRITVKKGSNTLKLMHSLIDKIFEEINNKPL
jgi:hypothetical protein